MIVDTFDNWTLYFSGDIWESILDFVAGLNENSSNGEYLIRGKDIFARVMSYQTKSREEIAFEAHKEYIDIQTVLDGAEGIVWLPVRSLTVRQSYDAANDVEFYEAPPIIPLRVDLSKGKFAALFPSDAHAAQLHVDGMPSRLKKVVVKVRTTYYLKSSI